MAFSFFSLGNGTFSVIIPNAFVLTDDDVDDEWMYHVLMALEKIKLNMVSIVYIFLDFFSILFICSHTLITSFSRKKILGQYVFEMFHAAAL